MHALLFSILYIVVFTLYSEDMECSLFLLFALLQLQKNGYNLAFIIFPLFYDVDDILFVFFSSFLMFLTWLILVPSLLNSSSLFEHFSDFVIPCLFFCCQYRFFYRGQRAIGKEINISAHTLQLLFRYNAEKFA